MNARRTAAVVVCFLGLVNAALAQPRVDPRNMYERCQAIVPLIGKGTSDDPQRPMYAPAPHESNSTSRTGILGFTYVLSDDGHFALVEYVARDRSAFSAILADRSIQSFLKGRDKIEDALAAFTKAKKNFNINTFGVRLP